MRPYSVIIPAHNEGKVITRCLEALLASGDDPEIVVVCNGCTDDTAARARAAAPGATVIELDVGSKPLALNTGNEAATVWPRFFLDADIALSPGALLATAEVLRAGRALAAAPAIKVDLTGCSELVRAYYEVWVNQPYVHDSMIGSGIFGLSEQGMARVGSFPKIISDDGYVRSRFSSDERASVSVDGAGNPVWFTVFPPRDVRSLVRIEGRRRAGDAQLRALYPTPETGRSTRVATIATAGRSSTRATIAYLAIKTAGRALLRWNRLAGKAGNWSRDESSRA